MKPDALDPMADPHLWLEAVESPEALKWVKARNAESETAILKSASFADIEADIRKVVLAPDRLPLGSYRGGLYYNFWQDDHHVRGIWRRTTLAEFSKADPRWELLLDLDALAAQEKENWVFKSAACLPPDGALCLLTLSRGGKDAVVVREFDVASKKFVTDGFSLPEAKSHAAWIDRDTIWIGTDLGPGTMTTSGYPRQTRLWKRGQASGQSALVYESKADDMSSLGFTIHRPEGAWSFVKRQKDFYSGELFRVEADLKLTAVPVPADADLQAIFEGRLFFFLKTAWKAPGAVVFPAGSVVTLSLARMADPPELLYAPGPREAVQSVTATRTQLFLSTLDNVQNKVLRAHRADRPAGAAEWVTEPLVPAAAKGVSVELQAADEFSDTVVVYETGFLTPPSVSTGDVSVREPRLEKIKSLPARFDAGGLMAEQFEATSKDGTKVPYFVVRPKALPHDGSAPTLLYGYGGFQVSMLPEYLGAVGKLWLEKRNAVYVLANIRGGGEFGPRWHQAALLENRQRAFDDFAAVARDVIAKKITSPAHLGIMGGSNGGLLVGATYAQHPELFGAVVCQVPLLDMLRYHKLLAGASWMAEYGNPDDAKMAAALRAYSPYQNLRAGVTYPRILFLTSTKDDRVHPGHARKMMARIEELGQPALLWENVEGGHGGAANLDQRVKFSALGWTFLWNQLGPRAN